MNPTSNNQSNWFAHFFRSFFSLANYRSQRKHNS